MPKKKVTPEQYCTLLLHLQEFPADWHGASEASELDLRTVYKAWQHGLAVWKWPSIQGILDQVEVLPDDLREVLERWGVEEEERQASEGGSGGHLGASAGGSEEGDGDEVAELPVTSYDRAPSDPSKVASLARRGVFRPPPEEEILQREEEADYLAERRASLKGQQEERQLRASSRSTALGSLAVSLRLLSIGTKVAKELESRSTQLDKFSARELRELLSSASSFAEKALKMAQGAVALEKQAVLRPEAPAAGAEGEMDEETAQQTLDKIHAELAHLIQKKQVQGIVVEADGEEDDDE